jgi:glycosyltransferase involved in cell wall biosynthesis
VFVITQELRRETAGLLPATPGRVSVVPMGVDTERFMPPTVSRSSDPEVFRWFCCARLNPVKGYDTLIAAADILRKSHPNLRFTVRLAGEDEQGGSGYRKEIEKQLEVYQLRETIVLLGAISQADVLAELQAADGFVLASRHEPLGVAYMEAMACGLPTLGTRAGGVEELMEDGIDSLLVAPGDPEALAGAMLKIMQDPELRTRIGHAARQKVATDFGANRSADALAERLHARI